MEACNIRLFELINAPAGLRGWRLDLALLCAEYLIYLVPALLVTLWLGGGRGRRGAAVLAACAGLLALALNQLIGLAVFHPRPSMLGVGHTYLSHAPDSSFPSDHVTLLWAVGLALLLRQGGRGYGAALLAMSLFVAWARVYLGVHFPFDMAGAMVVGTLSALALKALWPLCGDRLVRWGEGVYRRVFSRLILRGWLRP